MSARVLLSADGLVVNRGARKVLRGVDFSLSEGEVVGLVGVNGSGKTTLLETLAGLHSMSAGKVERHDSGISEIVRDSDGQRGNIRGFGLALQSDAICGDESVAERVRGACRVAGRADDEAAITQMLSDWGLGHRADDRVAKLSGGLRRRVAVLSSLAPAALNPDSTVVLLDEPSEGLDESSRELLAGWLGSLSALGHSILVATHDPEMIATCNRVVTVSESGSISSTESGTNSLSAPLPEPVGSTDHKEFVGWALRLEKRNPIDTLGRGVPALVALLLAHTLSTDIARTSENHDLLAGLILTPAFISAIVAPALIKRLAEERAGDWWRAMTGADSRIWFSIMGASFLLPLPIIYLSWYILSGDFDSDVPSWLWLFGLVIIDLSVAASALHLMVADLSRASAVPVSLLQLVLIWPFLQMTSALASIMTDGMSFELTLGEPIADIGIAWLSVVLIWAMAVIIPED